LVTASREINVGDTLKVIVRNDLNHTMVAYVNGTQVLSVVDNTYNRANWYAWIRGFVLRTMPRFDNFMVFTSSSLVLASFPAVTPQNGGQMPSTYQLKQNFPNPFNPATTIQFDLPNEGYVTLKIYNALGQEVASLIQ